MRMSPNITSILLIYTGGTIGMIENPETGALENFNPSNIKLRADAVYAIVSVPCRITKPVYLS